LRRTVDLTKKMLFSVKWQFMAPEKKYAYLWARTMKSWPQANPVRHSEHTESLIGG